MSENNQKPTVGKDPLHFIKGVLWVLLLISFAMIAISFTSVGLKIPYIYTGYALLPGVAIILGVLELLSHGAHIRLEQKKPTSSKIASKVAFWFIIVCFAVLAFSILGTSVGWW
ncbi:hypothetical protein ACFL0L_00760 [Patescibacteria group bacterium]